MIRANITYFIAVSMALHAGIFLAARHDEPVPAMPVGPVRVTLLTEVDTPPGKKTDTATSEMRPRKHKHANQSGKEPANKKPAYTDTAPARATIHASKAHTGNDSEATALQQTGKPARQATLSREHLADRLQGQIRKALLPHFSYPLLARRRGWEGTVRVGLRIEANGNLTRMHLVESSRHDILNKAAVRSLTQVARIPDASSWLHGQYLDLVLPIEYRLVDS